MFARTFPHSSGTIVIDSSATRFLKTTFANTFFGIIKASLSDLGHSSFPSETYERVTITVELDLLSEGHIVTISNRKATHNYAMTGYQASSILSHLSVYHKHELAASRRLVS
jgi:hypothetical protein